jgi:hypothetical protein
LGPEDLRFRTKGHPTIDVLTGAYADGLSFDFACGDEVYGSCTELREFLEDRGQAYVLHVATSLPSPWPRHQDDLRGRGEETSEEQGLGGPLGRPGIEGDRWYAWAWIGTSSPRHSLLVRHHLKTGELASHYRYVPEARLFSAARLRWPVEESACSPPPSATRSRPATPRAAVPGRRASSRPCRSSGL